MMLVGVSASSRLVVPVLISNGGSNGGNTSMGNLLAGDLIVHIGFRTDTVTPLAPPGYTTQSTQATGARRARVTTFIIPSDGAYNTPSGIYRMFAAAFRYAEFGGSGISVGAATNMDVPALAGMVPYSVVFGATSRAADSTALIPVGATELFNQVAGTRSWRGDGYLDDWAPPALVTATAQPYQVVSTFVKPIGS